MEQPNYLDLKAADLFRTMRDIRNCVVGKPSVQLTFAYPVLALDGPTLVVRTHVQGQHFESKLVLTPEILQVIHTNPKGFSDGLVSEYNESVRKGIQALLDEEKKT